MRFVIAGNGVAAIKAVEAIRSVDRASSITVLGKEEFPAYSPILTTYLVAGDVPLERIFYRTPDWYAAMDARLEPRTEVTAVDVRAKKVSARDGRTWEYDKLLVATGAAPRMLGEPGGGLPGVHGMRTLSDALALRAELDQVDRAVVLGGGLVGCKTAEALLKVGKRVAMVVGSDRIMSRNLPAEAADIVQRRALGHGLEFRLGARVARIVGRDRVQGVELAHGERLECQLVLAGKGIVPNAHLLGQARGLRVDDRMRTEFPDVYAAGDVTLSRNLISGEHEAAGIWPVAVEQGRTAGLNMAGASATCPPSLHRNVVPLFGLKVATAGLTVPRPGDRLVKHVDRNGETYRHVVLDPGSRVVGALLIGDVRRFGLAVSRIVQGAALREASQVFVPACRWAAAWVEA